MYYENFEDKNVGYAAYAAGVYGGTVKGYAEAENKVRELTKAINETRDLLDDKGYGASSRAKFVEKLNKLMDERNDLQKIMKDLTGAETFADQSIDNRPDYVPPVPGFSLAQFTGGRAQIDKNRKRLVSHKPGDTTIAQCVNEGETSDPVEILDLLDTIQTDGEARFTLSDVLTIPLNTKSDDPQVWNAATNAVHTVHMVNGENAKAFALLEIAQEALSTPYGSGVITKAINSRLSGDHKKNTVIITNKGGYAALDVDVNGVPQIKRGADGQLMYKEKYPIIEVDDHVLPYIGTDAPVFVGDLAQALQFYLIRDSILEKEEYEENGYMRFTVKDRMIREEIIKVTTASPEVWFWMTLANAKDLVYDPQDDTGEESAPGDENQPSEDQPPVIDDPIDDPQPPEGTTDNEDSVEAVALCTEDQLIEDSQPSENQIGEGLQPTEDTEEIPGDSDTAETA